MNPFKGGPALPSLLPFVLLLLVSLDSVWALDPTQPANSYLRTRFAAEDGLPSTLVENMVQSQDGFLWLRVNGTQLARFDGRRFNVFDGLGRVLSLAVAPNGDLWVGTTDDLKQIPAAALNQFDPLPTTSYHPGPGFSSNISALHFARNGVLWVGTAAGLYRFDHGAFVLTISGTYIEGIEERADAHLWVSTRRGPMEWDGSRAVLHPELEAQLGIKTSDIFYVREDSHGITWFCTANGLARRIGGSVEKLEPWGPFKHQTYRAYEDHQGSVWFARVEGLFRVTAAGLELVAAGMQVRSMYSDRDGDLWIGTNGDGLYRFKDRAVRMFTTADGLPGNVVMTVLASHDGTVWAGFNCGGLARFDGLHFQIYNEKNGLLNSCVWTLAEDLNHDLWIGTYGGGFFRFRDGEFTQYSKAQGIGNNYVLSMVVARDGSLWFTEGAGVGRIRDGQIRNYTKADGLSSRITLVVYEDRAGGIWVSGLNGTDRLAGDRFVPFSPFPKTTARPLGEDRSGNLYFAHEPQGGIFRLEDNHTVPVAPEIEADEVLETRQGDLWFTGTSILRVPQSGLVHPRQPDEPLNFEPFGLADGLAALQVSGGYRTSALTPDGKLWIATNQGLAMFDLARLPSTDRKPSIYVEEVIVGRNSQGPGHELVLPAGTHHVELNFDAIEISSPEKIRLQYRLDSVDPEWLDAKPPARAIYSNIPPGTHAFHVRACNRGGIWDLVGMVYYITQQPYFYQTRWFLAATIAFGLLLIAGAYQFRLRQVVARLNMQIETRVAERTRIARELHDTLLQSFSALLLRFQTVSKMLPARPEDAKQRVDSAIEQASRAIAEGRDAVHELRSEGPAENDLAQVLGNFGKELLSGLVSEKPPEFHVQVEGTPKNLNPLIRDEAYRIAAEALRNAIRHAEAGRIEVDIRYDEQNLRVRIRDNGKGINPEILEQGHAPGHWGLHGMRERAKLLGGNLEVWSKVGSGSEVELTIPAANAYAKPASRWSVLWRGLRSEKP